MKKTDSDIMGWNAPGQDNGGGASGDDDGNRGRSGGGGENNDPWGRQNRRNRGGLDSESIMNALNKFFRKSGWSGRGSSGTVKKGAGWGLTIVLALVLGFVIFNGFYTVREAERGVVLRFGKLYDVVDPGLRWKVPGIDTVTMVDIEQVRALQSSGTMLTQDENVVIVEMDVQYRIADPYKYLYALTDPDHTLLEATDSALRYVVGHTLMDDILTSGREMVRQNTRELLTSIIEPYNTGLSIVDVNFLPARAPDQVKAAFDDAIAAQEDEQRYKREAEAYANEVLPKADGKVQRIRQEAEAYRSQVVLDAQGEVARFEKVLPEYQAAPEITRKRIYLETMEEVMNNSRKVIINTPEGSSPLLYMPLPQQEAASPRAMIRSKKNSQDKNTAAITGSDEVSDSNGTLSGNGLASVPYTSP